MPTAAQTLPTFTGAVVDGRFKLQEILGSGTFGVVYKAVEMRTAHLPTPTYRAIKIMRKAGRRQRELTNIRREVALHAAIGRVPGVVHMYDSWDDAVFFFLVLELCPGGDLFTQIRVRKVFKHNEALLRRTFIKLVDALQVCHDAGVAHRDLKPENILASEGAEDVYIADFGLATTKRKVAEFRIGTDGYMSPGTFTLFPVIYRRPLISFPPCRVYWRVHCVPVVLPAHLRCMGGGHDPGEHALAAAAVEAGGPFRR